MNANDASRPSQRVAVLLKTRAGTKGKGLFENLNLSEVLMVGRLENGLIEVGLMPILDGERNSKLGM